MEDVERKVLEAIDLDGLLAFLKDLVAIRSLGGEERPAQEFVAAALGRLGLSIDRWEIDLAALRRHPSFSMEVERSGGLGVVGTLKGSGRGRSLLLNGHVDVVPPGDAGNWTSPPWEATFREGQVVGRGTVDMKGGLACALFAIRAIVDAGVRLKGDLGLESVIGEEDGGVGTLASCLRGHRADGAILLEPTELTVAPAQAGALSFRVTVPGLSAHAAVREEGVSAVEKFHPIHDALLALEKERNRAHRDPLYARYDLPYALSIGRVSAGNWSSSVPEALTFEGRYGVAVDEDVADARRSFEAAVATAAAADPWLRGHPPRVEWWGGQFEPARIPTDHALPTTILAAFADANGRPSRLEGMTYGSDMRHLVKVGETPAVLFGPGDVRRAHRPDESVPVEDLVAATRAVALAALLFCGVED